MNVEDTWYPDDMLRCGVPIIGGRLVCGLPLTATAASDAEAEYACARGHRLGPVSAVDEDVEVQILARLVAPRVWPRLAAWLASHTAGVDSATVSGTPADDSDPTATLTAWWGDASVPTRRALTQLLIDHVLVPPAGATKDGLLVAVTTRPNSPQRPADDHQFCLAGGPASPPTG